jgi:hypothetical protein
MFIVEGRTLGVFAALGVVLSMVVLNRLSAGADSTEPRSLPAFATAIATPLPAMRRDSELAPPRERCSDTFRQSRRRADGHQTVATTEPSLVGQVALVEATRVNPDDAAC